MDRAEGTKNWPLYSHKPLQSPRAFRVLELQPAKSSTEPLLCELREVSLDDKPDFEALSYVWGNPEKSHNIRCRGSIIPCTVNCAVALRALRLLDKHRILWVDAICINQDYTPEKNTQVRLMGEIYASATKVVVWLGIPSKSSEAALKNVLSTVKRSLYWHLPDWRRYFFKALIPGYMQRKYGDPDLRRILEWEWFSRVWTVQELLVNSKPLTVTVQFGSIMVYWEEFYAAIIWAIAYRIPEANDSLVRSRDELQQLYQTAEQLHRDMKGDMRIVLNLMPFFLAARSYAATDPKDRVYSFFGLFDRLGIPWPQPDYDKPVSQVLHEATMAIMTYNKTLNILYYTPRQRPIPNLPTWVPSWESTAESPNMLWENIPNEFMEHPPSKWAQHSTFPTRYTVSKDKSVLHLGGTVLGTVSVVGDIIELPDPTMLRELPTGYQHERYLQALCDWSSRAVGNDFDDASIRGSFVDVLLAYDRLLKRTSADLQRFRAFTIFDKLATKVLDSLDSDASKLRPLDLNARSFLDPRRLNDYGARELSSVLVPKIHESQHALFRTNCGRVGGGFHAIQPGDMVVLLEGVFFPIVLRELLSDLWQVVGPAFVAVPQPPELRPGKWDFPSSAPVNDFYYKSTAKGEYRFFNIA